MRLQACYFNILLYKLLLRHVTMQPAIHSFIHSFSWVTFLWRKNIFYEMLQQHWTPYGNIYEALWATLSAASARNRQLVFVATQDICAGTWLLPSSTDPFHLAMLCRLLALLLLPMPFNSFAAAVDLLYICIVKMSLQMAFNKKQKTENAIKYYTFL